MEHMSSDHAEQSILNREKFEIPAASAGPGRAFVGPAEVEVAGVPSGGGQRRLIARQGGRHHAYVSVVVRGNDGRLQAAADGGVVMAR